MTSNPEKTQFGARDVTPVQKTQLVRGVFDSVADKYDLMNDVMSGGLHRLWKDQLIRQIRPRAGLDYLDVAGGTGDIAFRIKSYIDRTSKHAHRLDALQRKAVADDRHKKTHLNPSVSTVANAPSDGRETHLNPSVSTVANASSDGRECKTNITLLDLNQHMLAVGRDRAINKGWLDDFDWITGNAEDLPLPDESQDVYTIAFGLRNVTHIDTALKEAYRVLRPGGRFYCLEFSHVDEPFLGKLYDSYSYGLIPKMGKTIAQDEESYQYLVESIRKFPRQAALCARLEQAGFTRARARSLTFGVVAIHSAFKA